MKSITLAFFTISVLALISCGSYYGPPATTPAPAQPPAATQAPAQAPIGAIHQVAIKGFAFNPSTIAIKKGDTINWTNEDSVAHTATGPGFDSGTLGTGRSFRNTFNEAGTFNYQCNIHPRMKATVVVQP